MVSFLQFETLEKGFAVLCVLFFVSAVFQAYHAVLAASTFCPAFPSRTHRPRSLPPMRERHSAVAPGLVLFGWLCAFPSRVTVWGRCHTILTAWLGSSKLSQLATASASRIRTHVPGRSLLLHEVFLSHFLASPDHPILENSRLPTNTKTVENNKKIVNSIEIKFDHHIINIFGKNVTMKLKRTYNLTSLYKKIRKYLKLNADISIYFFSKNNMTPLLHGSALPKEITLAFENKFGSTHTEPQTPSRDPELDPTGELEEPSLDGDDSDLLEARPHSPSSTHIVSALYCNTDGLSSSKVKTIQAESSSDTFVIGNEWNKLPQDVSLLADYFGKRCFVKSCYNFTYVDGSRIPIHRKKKGYCTGIVCRSDLSMTDVSVVDSSELPFEILPVVFDIPSNGKTVKVGCISVYRSPSMPSEETAAFYSCLKATILRLKDDSQITGILYVGDPNKSSSKQAASLENEVIQETGLLNLIGDVPTRRSLAGNYTQPDSCFAWFDVTKIVISARVIGQLHPHMDHRAIRISFDVKGVPPKLPTFRDVTYKVRRTDVSDKEVSKYLGELFDSWLETYKSLLYDQNGKRRTNWCYIPPPIVDCATNDYLKIIQKVKEYAYEIRHARWPTEAPDGADNLTVQIARLHSKLGQLSHQMQQDGTSNELLSKFAKLENERLELLRLKTQNRIDLCIKKQIDTNFPRQHDVLYNWTKKLLSRDGFLKQMRVEKSKEEIESAMVASDLTFTNNDPDYNHRVLDFRTVTPQRKFSVDCWNPSSNEKDYLAEYIEKKRKIDPFYKCNASGLSNPTFTLLKLIETTEYFPLVLRNSKITILPARNIFSAESLPKIVESILALEFNNCMAEDYKLNGDPHQMAYEPGRGTTSCNAITFTHVDLNLANGSPCIQKFIDIRKAFNVLCRALMLYLLHKIAGAGFLVKSRFLNRTYTDPFGNKRSCEAHNTGVDAGLPIPVVSFKAGINSDVHLTSKNKELDWASVYSDDRSSLARTAKRLQKAVNGSYLWSRLYHHPYHNGTSCCLDDAGISRCKKPPAVMAYWRVGMKVPADFYNMSLGESPFTMTFFQRNLGLNISTDHSVPGYKRIVDSQGYVFLPEVDRIKSLAYRMQDVKNDFIPSFKRMMILCYFCGVINSAACLYWLRSSIKDLNRLRFYYAMGISAVVGETAMGTLGASCCKNMSVSEDNSRMKALLDMTGLKSIREIALTDAVSTIKQVASIRPEWFLRNPAKRKRKPVSRFGISSSKNSAVNEHEAVTKAEIPTQLSNDIFRLNPLIADIWRMACEKVISDFENRKNPTKVKSVHKFDELWRVSEKVCREENPKCSANEILMTYHEACRSFLGSSNIQERRLARLTVSRPLRIHKTCRVSAPPPWLKIKSHSRYSFNCFSKPPFVLGATDPCQICGYSTDKLLVSSFRRCRSCKKPAHKNCLDQLFLVSSLFRCKSIVRPLGLNATELRPKPEIPAKPCLESSRCLICGSSCKPNDDDRVDCSVADCNYGAHEGCAAILACVNDDLLNCAEFRCNCVNYYLKPSEVSAFSSGSVVLAELKRLLAQRGMVNTKLYSHRRKRYENPDVTCNKCGETVGITEVGHMESYCTAPGLGTPVPTKDYEYIESRIRRARKFILLDSYNPT